jgi:hypothetical protein
MELMSRWEGLASPGSSKAPMEEIPACQAWKTWGVSCQRGFFLGAHIWEQGLEWGIVRKGLGYDSPWEGEQNFHLSSLSSQI